jgi:hypothetical protein
VVIARRHRRVAAVLGVAALAVPACSGSAGSEVVDASPGGVLAADSDAASLLDTDAPDPATSPAPPVAPATPSAPPVAPVDVPDTVDVHRPDVVIRTADQGASSLYAAFTVDGVEQLAGVAAFDSLLVADDGVGHPVTVLAVDPTTFRSFTPSVTAQEPGVWERLAEGDVVVRHDVAHHLGLQLGGGIELHGPDHQVPVRIGAYASNGAPPFADLIVPWDVGSRLGAGEVNTLLVALAEDASASRAGEELVAAIGGGDFKVRETPEAQQAARIQGTGARTTFEPFSYTDLGDGMIVIDPAWVRKWIVTVDLPRLGRTRVHRVMAPQLMAALREVDAAGLYGHFEADQFAGAWVPRHIDWNPGRALSMHAWGLAIDFNSRDNGLGRAPQMDRRIVAIFEKWGFEWGGHWSRPDGMHFELDRVVNVG